MDIPRKEIVCGTQNVGRINDTLRKHFGSIKCNRTVGVQGRDAFQIGVWRYSGATTVAIDVGVCIGMECGKKDIIEE